MTKGYKMDKNLKLLVLENLYFEDDEIKKQIDAIDVEPLHKLLLENKKYDWFDKIPEIENQLLAIEIDDNLLKKVTSLSGEGYKVYGMIMPNWDGEGDEFDIQYLSGIEKMPNLEEIGFIDFNCIIDAELLLQTNIKRLFEFFGLDEDIEEQLEIKGVDLD